MSCKRQRQFAAFRPPELRTHCRLVGIALGELEKRGEPMPPATTLKLSSA